MLLGRISKMTRSKPVQHLKQMLFSGGETDRMISAGVVRTIFADITRLYFENKQQRGKGILVFNPEQPDKSRYVTVNDIENDIALAQEACCDSLVESLEMVLKVIEKEAESDIALVATISELGTIAIYPIDSDEINKMIDELSNGLIL
jgi:hypothetical protein